MAAIGVRATRWRDRQERHGFARHPWVGNETHRHVGVPRREIDKGV